LLSHGYIGLKGKALADTKIKVLLAEAPRGGSLFWEQILAEVKDPAIEFVHVENTAEIPQRIALDSPDVILLDLTLADGSFFEIFQTVFKMVPTIPIIIVTENDDRKLAIQTVMEGAQDCLVKRDVSGFILGRAMRYAIGRQRHLKALDAISVIDELTGLYTRRGFLMLADQQIKAASLKGASLLLIFADVDDLKVINDSLGHHPGDLALMETAHVLREAFRETDVLGRLSGDEFVALLTCVGEVNEAFVQKRFQETIDEHNAYSERSYKLSVSIGVALYDPLTPCSAEDLLIKADSIMYLQKRSKKA
jgi:diguanylate cyclase (GGDEF)-like protein